VEPNSSLGQAFAYLLKRWETLTPFLRIPGAPLDSNTVERALKRFIRQRRNSLFYATAHGAGVASLLTRLIATCGQAASTRWTIWWPCNCIARRVPPAGGVAAVERSGEPGARLGGPGPGLGHRAPVGGHGGPVGQPFQSSTCSSRATRGTAAPAARGHHWSRPCDNAWYRAKIPGRRNTAV